MRSEQKISWPIAIAIPLLSGCFDATSGPRVIEVQAVSCAVEPSPCTTIFGGAEKIARYMTFSVPFTDMKTGQSVGTDDGYCQWVKHTPDRLICTKSATFKSGSIKYGGLFIPGQKENTFSINGGTGAFRNASGVVRVEEIPSAYRFEFMIEN